MAGSDGVSGGGRPAGLPTVADALRAGGSAFIGLAPGSIAATAVGAAGALRGNGGNAEAQALQAGQQLLASSGMSGKPRLPEVNEEMAKIDEASGQALLDALSNKTNEQSIKSLANELRGDKNRSKRTTDERVKVIQEATQKAMEAAKKENSFFSKLFGFIGKVLGPISSVLTFAAGAALTATGVGAPLGVFLMAQGAMGVASTVMDIVDEVRKSQGKEPIGWRPSFGFFISKGLEAVGVPKDTAMWIGVAVEVTAAVAAVVGSGGAAAGKVLASGAKAVKAAQASVKGMTLENVKTVTARINQVTTVLTASANIGKQAINIQVAGLRKEGQMAEARAKELEGAVARLLKQIQFNNDMIKDFAKRIQEINESVSSSVSSRTEVGVAVAQNMRLSG